MTDIPVIETLVLLGGAATIITSFMRTNSIRTDLDAKQKKMQELQGEVKKSLVEQKASIADNTAKINTLNIELRQHKDALPILLAKKDSENELKFPLKGYVKDKFDNLEELALVRYNTIKETQDAVKESINNIEALLTTERSRMLAEKDRQIEELRIKLEEVRRGH